MYGELPEIKTTDGQMIQGFPVEIKRPRKIAILRLPKDDEMIEYLSKQRSTYKDLGRRMGEGEVVPTPQADLDLFLKLRLDTPTDDSQIFNAAEAAKGLRLITIVKTEPAVPEGDGYRITLKTLFGTTVHVVNTPYEEDMALYQRTVYKPRDLPHGIEERRFPPEAPIGLYDKVIESVEGYADGITKNNVPPHHKRAVIFELVNVLNDLDPTLDPNA